jgi:hypothetical protein
VGTGQGRCAVNVPVPLRRVAPWLIGAAAVVAAGLAGWDNSATNDEPYHLLAAWTYVHDGHADLNPEHPPLAKLVAGAALLLLDPRPSPLPPVRRLFALNDDVHRFLYENDVPAITMLRVARCAELAFLAALLAGVYLWARSLWGPDAALLALLAVAAQPLVLGHAMVVHTDVAGAAGWVWTLYAAQRWIAGARRGWLAAGAALGLALLAKFNTVLLVPVLALAALLRCRQLKRLAPLAELVGSLAVAGAVLVAGYFPAVRNVGLDEERATIAAHLGQWPGHAGEIAATQRLAAISVPLAHWRLGVGCVQAASEAGQGFNVLLGRTSVRGFALYFPIAFAVKTSLPFLLLVVGGLVGSALRRDHRDLVPLVAAAVFCASLVGTTFNIGARHLLPLLPLLAVVASRHAFLLPGRIRLALAAALVASPVLAYPSYIAHFSALVGGSRYGARYMNDSNLDWGQDWRRLAERAERERWSPMTVVYVGAGCPECDLPGSVSFTDTLRAPESGYVAVSSWAAAAGADYLAATGDPASARALRGLLADLARRATAVADIGHTIAVYHLPGPPPP